MRPARHFKAITRLTPQEYQKQLRLQEARRLMLTEGSSAGAAGFAVVNESPSQFSREYRRLFGAPPRRTSTGCRSDGIVSAREPSRVGVREGVHGPGECLLLGAASRSRRQAGSRLQLSRSAKTRATSAMFAVPQAQSGARASARLWPSGVSV